MVNDEERLQRWREKWRRSNDLQLEALPIVRGLRDGDLKPLAAYLKGGGLKDSPEEIVSIPEWLASEIVSMIEQQPWCWFWLDVRGRHQNEQGWSRELETKKRNFTIGYFVLKQQRDRGRGSYEAVLQDAEAHFKADRATIKRAHAFVKRWIRDHKEAAGDTAAEERLLKILDEHHDRDMLDWATQSRD